MAKTTLASARALVIQIADEIGSIEHQISIARKAGQHDWANALECQHTKAYRSLRGAKGAVTRLMNRGVEA